MEAPERVVELPNHGTFHSFAWAPDGLHFVLQKRTDQAMELWVGDTASGRLRQMAGIKLNTILSGAELSWLNSHELLVLTVPDKRGAMPVASRVR